MSQPCTADTCKRKSRALCHCCSKNLCLDHLKEHSDLSNSQLYTFVDEINICGNQLLALNTEEIISNCRQKLDKWRDDCYMIINRFYEEKNQELQQRCTEKLDKHREEIDEMKMKLDDLIREQEATNEDIPVLKATINDMKRDIKQFEQKGIIVDVRPLVINKDLIYIEEWTSNEVVISTFPSSCRTVNCSNEDWPAMASNNQFLLLDQYPNLCLLDRELTIVKQIVWEHDRIPDMCWSSTLNSFIIITDKSGVFLVNEDMTLIESIQTIKEENWLSCTCSDAALFITTNESGSSIFEFNLLSSFGLIKQWDVPKSCTSKELIHNIAYNNGTLALILKDQSDSSIRIEVRSSTTLDQFWSLPLDIPYSYGRIYRICLLKCDEWLVLDHNTSRLIHISKDGKLKVAHKYTPIPHNAVLFGSNILAIRTTECVNFYGV